jgi:hypothetical protein
MVQFVKLLEPNGKDYVFINPDQVCRVGNPSPGDPSVRIDLAGGQSQVVKGPLAGVVAAFESQERLS